MAAESFLGMNPQREDLCMVLADVELLLPGCPVCKGGWHPVAGLEHPRHGILALQLAWGLLYEQEPLVACNQMLGRLQAR